MQFITEVLATSIVSTAILAVLGYFMRATIGELLTGRVRQRYAKDLEQHKSSLKTEGEITLERLKSELQADAAISQIRHSTQYEKAAGVIVGVHGRMDDAFNAVAAYTSILETPSMGTKAARREKVNESIIELRDYYRKNRIYLPTALAKRIKQLEEQLFDAADQFSMNVEHREPNEDRATKAWTAAYHKMKDEVKPMLETLEQHFRNMLGINQMFADIQDGEPCDEPKSR